MSHQYFRVHRELTTRELKPVLTLYAGSMLVATIPYVENGGATLQQLRLESFHKEFYKIENFRPLVYAAIAKLNKEPKAIIRLEIYDLFYQRDNG